nr:MAG TPA: hypothetical protein [Caudoviricetes sp.]
MYIPYKYPLYKIIKDLQKILIIFRYTHYTIDTPYCIIVFSYG